jgi:hypothetical protein
MEPQEHVVGYEKVTAIMGHWPSFHDAEVISITLGRAFPFISGSTLGRLKVVVREYEPAKVGTVDFHMAFKRGAVVDFIFEDVGDVLLEDFNHQNVVNSISVVPADITGKRLKVEIESIYGIGGHLYCNTVEIHNVQELTENAI